MVDMGDRCVLSLIRFVECASQIFPSHRLAIGCSQMPQSHVLPTGRRETLLNHPKESHRVGVVNLSGNVRLLPAFAG